LRRIIITADDFGAAREVNEAVERAHREGVLTAASLMIGAPEAADAVARARRLPALRLGLHLVLTEGRPILPPVRVPDLVDRSGAFRTDIARVGASIFFNPSTRAQAASEIEAQFEAFRATGLRLDHANAHQHFHLHPTIGGLMVGIGRRYGLTAVRGPLEPPAVLAKVGPVACLSSAWLTAPFARLLCRRLCRAGMLVPDWVFGLRWSGHMTRDRLVGLIRNAPDGLSEIYLHPATGGEFPGSVPGYRYREELEALVSPEAVAAARETGVALGGFADFLSPVGGSTVG
jgi:hopanoid biosynthesis associated protein HpnK